MHIQGVTEKYIQTLGAHTLHLENEKICSMNIGPETVSCRIISHIKTESLQFSEAWVLRNIQYNIKEIFISTSTYSMIT